MAIAAKTFAGKVNLDSTASTLNVPFVTASGDAVVVYVAVKSANVTVLSVTDTAGNVYVKKTSGTSKNAVHDYNSNIAGDTVDDLVSYDDAIDAEAWVTVASATAASSLTVTLVSGSTCAVAVQSYTGANVAVATAFPQAAFVSLTKGSTPTNTLTGMTSTSYLSACYASCVGLNQLTPRAGTLRQEVTASSADKSITLVVVDNIVTGTSSTVTLAPASEIDSPDGISEPVPEGVAVCCVEVHV